MKKIKGKRLLMGFLFFFLIAQMGFSASRKRLVERIESAGDYINDIMESPDTSIPEELLEECRGIAILRQYKAGFILGVKGGSGVVLVKDEKTKMWSPPAFVATAEGSYGFQIGGQSIDAILLIMNKDGLDMLLKSKFKIGVDASAAAGPVGRDVGAKISADTAILIYSRAKGAYVGITFEGGVFVSDDKANEEFYGIKNIKVRDILFRNRVKMPEEAKPLIDTLMKYTTP